MTERKQLHILSKVCCCMCVQQDTPRSSFQFGSLVVCLPVPHKGGDLVVRHDGSEKVSKWKLQTAFQGHLQGC